MKPKTLKPLANFGQIRKRIIAVAAHPPASPLKGRGNVRICITLPLIYTRLQTLAPSHCETIAERVPINRFGKLGYVPTHYLSPEMAQVIAANDGDFRRLELALVTVAKSGLF